MGFLIYGESGVRISFDDRALAHIQLVIGAKLRRHESFYFSWTDDHAKSNGKTSLWVDAGIPLQFKYTEHTPPAINRQWLELLSRTASSAQGMFLLPEPAEASAVAPEGAASPEIVAAPAQH